MVYTTNTGTNASVAQGVQQPYEISTVTGIEGANGINLTVSAYPNLPPIILRWKLGVLTFQLYDLQGKLLQSERITGNQTSIAMGNLASAIYFVKVMEGNKEVKTFKIIKTQ